MKADLADWLKPRRSFVHQGLRFETLAELEARRPTAADAHSSTQITVPPSIDRSPGRNHQPPL